MEILLSLEKAGSASSDLSLAKRLFTEHFASMMVREWRTRVHNDFAVQPTTLEAPKQSESDAATAVQLPSEEQSTRTYGSTLLAVLATETYLVFVQLGDGEIVVVSHEGAVSQPFPHDSRLIADETTSLVSPAPEREMRIAFQALAGTPPALILLASDGYANSFSSSAEFLKAGSDILHILRSRGEGAIAAELEGWLEISAEMSGDDTTMGVIVYRRLDSGSSFSSEQLEVVASGPVLEGSQVDAARWSPSPLPVPTIEGPGPSEASSTSHRNGVGCSIVSLIAGADHTLLPVRELAAPGLGERGQG
jgi:hypothetical protein